MKSFSHEVRIGKISTVKAKERRGAKMKFENMVKIWSNNYFLRQERFVAQMVRGHMQAEDQECSWKL